MIILHGALLDGRLFVWGEAPPRPRRGARRKNGVAPYPYDAGFAALSGALGSLGLEPPPDAHREESATAWLPTVSEQPFPSSALIGDSPDAEGETLITPWRVSGLRLDASESLDLLATHAGRSQHGVVAGRDLRFWILALREAGSLVTRQRFLPGMVEQEGHWHARWQPVWLGEDAELLEELARDMPAAARALTRDADAGPPDTPPRRAVEAFVGAAVDQLVRSHANDGLPVVANGATGANVVERWLGALRAPESEVTGEPEALAQLADVVRDWRRPVETVAAAPFRLCFRLEEPAPAKEEAMPRRGRRHGRNRPGREAPRPGQRRWYVRFLLQSADDPNLLVPTADAWIIRGRKAAALARSGTDLHAALLASMVQAAGVAPRIEESLRSRKPSGFSLDARGAHEFLTRTAPALQQAGFGVILPTWWTEAGSAYHLGVRARVHTPERRDLDYEPSLDESIAFDWEVVVGGRPLSGRDLEELSRLKEPLLQVRGHWIETHVEEVHAAQMFWKNRRAGEVTARELVRMGLGSADTSAGIRFEGVDASGWLGELLRNLTDKGSIAALRAPEGFTGLLRPYQEKGYAWLDTLGRYGLGACLADDMGLGKTIQTLALIERQRAAGEDRPVLLVCPTSVLTNWQREAARFTPRLGVTVHHGAGRAKGYDLQQRAYAHAVVLTSYALLHRDLEDLHMIQWSGVVLDEAQNIKNPSTKQSQAVRTLK
ncbi:MAG TPA: DEAD/DEAH box helicase, partial [Myxococcota bacterium]|nr:DEAD/DEAH box helicase [Myxococcota bacterium]